jgi:hypothetical protein
VKGECIVPAQTNRVHLRPFDLESCQILRGTADQFSVGRPEPAYSGPIPAILRLGFMWLPARAGPARFVCSETSAGRASAGLILPDAVGWSFGHFERAMVKESVAASPRG